MVVLQSTVSSLTKQSFKGPLDNILKSSIKVLGFDVYYKIFEYFFAFLAIFIPRDYVIWT